MQMWLLLLLTGDISYMLLPPLNLNDSLHVTGNGYTCSLNYNLKAASLLPGTHDTSYLICFDIEK